MREVCAVKNVRVWFTKEDACRYISHLDVNRAMTRALQLSKIPLWHTEGYNSRMYVSFPLSLSLGFRGMYEAMDIKLLDDDFPLDDIPKILNPRLPNGLSITSAKPLVMKTASIAYADFTVFLTAEDCSVDEVFSAAEELFSKDEIIVEKKSKKGMKQTDIRQKINRYTLNKEGQRVRLDITLPAGSTENVNPSLFVSAMEHLCGFELFSDISRTMLYTETMENFV